MTEAGAEALATNPAPRPRVADREPLRRVSQTQRLNGILLILGLLALGEASARFGWVASANWPPVTSVMRAIGTGLSGELGLVLLSTLSRMLGGYAVGCACGVGLGVVLGTNRWARYILKPLIELLRPIPAPAIVPALILFLGVDNVLKITVVALACFFPVFLNTLAGVAGVDEVVLQTGRTFRVSSGRLLLNVILPASLPMIAAGMRVAIGVALVVTVIAEMIAGSAGVGYYIVQMQYAMRPEEMYAAVICLAAIGYLLNSLFLIIEARYIPWLGR